MMTRIAAVLLLFLPFSAAAQRGVPTINPRANQVSVDVRIVTEDDHRLDSMVRVQLLKFGGSTVSEVSVSDGVAQLSGITPGSYTLRLTGPAIEETVTPPFEVRPAGLNVMQIVRVKLRATAGVAPGPKGAISAKDLNIPPKAKKEFDKAGDAMRESDWTIAADHLQKAISIYPDYAAAYNNLGVVALRQGDVPQAKLSFNKAIELNDSSGSAFVNLGRLYLRERNYQEVARLMNKALALDPGNPEALTILSDCDVQAGKYDEAIALAKRVHAMPHERFAVAHLIAAAAYERQNDVKDASAEYEQFLKEDPRSPRAAGARKSLERLSAASQPGGDDEPKP